MATTIRLELPFSEEKIRALKVGDEVLISGTVTGGGARVSAGVRSAEVYSGIQPSKIAVAAA